VVPHPSVVYRSNRMSIAKDPGHPGKSIWQFTFPRIASGNRWVDWQFTFRTEWDGDTLSPLTICGPVWTNPSQDINWQFTFRNVADDRNVPGGYLWQFTFRVAVITWFELADHLSGNTPSSLAVHLSCRCDHLLRDSTVIFWQFTFRVAVITYFE
jgi:hypothetical protein